jgi:O-antigen/teichoic acid export membrane protein
MDDSAPLPLADTPADAPEPQVARQSVGLMFATVSGNVGFFLSALILARQLGPSGRGEMAFFVVSALLGGGLVGFGISRATAVFAAKDPGRRAAVLGNGVCLGAVSGVAGGVLVAGVLSLLNQHLPAGFHGRLLELLALAIAASSMLNIGLEFLRGCGKLHVLGLVNAVTPWLYTVQMAYLVLGPGLTVARAASAWTVYAVASALISIALSLRISGIAKPTRPLIRESLSFGIRAWSGSIARILNARADQIVMGFITTEAALGLYAVAVNVSEVMLYLPNATADALLPAIMRSSTSDLAARTLAVLRRLTVVTAFSSVIAIVVGVPLIAVVFGPSFTGSIPPFLLLLPAGLGYGALVVSEAALLAIGAPHQASQPMVIALTVDIVLVLVLVPPFGASGAAAATSIACLASGLSGLVFLRRRRAFHWSDTFPQRSDVVYVARRARSFIRPFVRWTI